MYIGSSFCNGYHLELESPFLGFSGRRWRKKGKIKIEMQVKLVKEFSIVEMSGMGEIDAREIALVMQCKVHLFACYLLLFFLVIVNLLLIHY